MKSLKTYCREKSGIVGLMNPCVECVQYIFFKGQNEETPNAHLVVGVHGVHIVKFERLHALMSLQAKLDSLDDFEISTETLQYLSLKTKP